MKNWVYTRLESIINQTLALDPEAQAQLAQLAGRSVALDITDWRIHCALQITEQGVRLLIDMPESVDARLSGPLMGLLQTMQSGGSSSTMRQSGLRMEGDVQLAEQLKHILSRLDIDWEAPLQDKLGPTVSGGIGIGLRKLHRIGKQVFQSGRQQISTFLKTDSDCLPSDAEVTQFNRAVTVLRHDMDRLEARWDNWRAKQKESS